MYLPPLFVLLLLSSFVTPTEETLQFELPSILTSFFGIGNNGSSLSRHKRAADVSIKEYSVDIEVSFQDSILQHAIKTLIANLSFPINLTDSATSIQRINVTTVCNQVGDNLQCACEQGFIWAKSICNTNTPCDVSTKDSCNCINVTVNNGLYCKAKDANNLEKSFCLKINELFTEDLKNTSKKAYIDLKTTVETQLFISYSTLPGFESAEVKGFRNGSVLADYTIVAEAVTDATMQEANARLIENLSKNMSVSRILTITSENITVSKTFPSTDVFVGDRVDILCTVFASITSETSVKWYLSGNEITNSSSIVITNTQSVSSTLQINSVTGSDAGTYKCIVETDLYSYQSEYNLTAQDITMTTLNTNIPCNNTIVSVVQCCPSGDKDLLNLTCQNMSGNYQSSKYTYLNPGTSCRILNISASLIECNGGATTTFTCTCSSNHGAVKSEPVTVNYAQSKVQLYNNTNVHISQGTELVLVCDGTAPISWSFSMNGSFQHSFPVTSEYVIFQNETSLAVKIPKNRTNLSWQGTFFCYNLFSTAESNVTVISLFPSDRISIQPITFNYVNGQQQTFQCCVPDYGDHYTKAVVLTSTKLTIDMVKNGLCFTAVHTFSDSTEIQFQANCQIFNSLNDFVHSRNMTGTRIERSVIMCNDSQISVGVPGNNVTVSCEAQDATKTGTIIYLCSTSGKWIQFENNCVSATLNRLSVNLEELTSPGSVDMVPSILTNINAAVTTEKSNITSSPSELKFVVQLLIRVDAAVTTVEESTMQNFLSTVNVVVDNSSVNTWRDVSNESGRLLAAVDQFAEKLVFSDSVEIKNTNLQLAGRVITAGESNSFNKSFDFSQLNNLTGHVLIKKVDAIQENRSIVSIAYATLKDILPVDNATWGNKTLNGLVMSTITHLKNDTPFSISMDYEKSDKRKNKAQCVFWNVTEKQWDNNGCSVVNTDNDSVTCNCSHLTSFSILMSYEDEPIDPTAPPKLLDKLLAYITYIGVGISILSLVICIGVEATVWKSVTKNKTSYMRHVCIVNIAVSLLIADICFIVGAALTDMEKKAKFDAASDAVLKPITDACVAVTFFTHLFYLSVFFWMLTMALILFYRLVYVFHDLSKTVMMSISFALGYGCPLVISVITVAVTQPNEAYTSNNACWLTTGESKAFIAFVVPALAILLVNTIILCVVLRKLCRPAIGDKQKKDEADTLRHIAKCIVILTPLLGLTWGLGIGTMSSKEDWIHILFTIVNSLQGFFILLFGCLMDKKVREALFNKFSFSRFSSQQTKSTNISSSDSPFSKTVMSRGVLTLFARKGEKKGSYNINSAQESSSSDIPSNSYSLLQ